MFKDIHSLFYILKICKFSDKLCNNMTEWKINIYSESNYL